MLYAKTPHKSSDRAFRSPRTRNLRTPNRSFNQAFGNSAVSDRLRYAARPRSLSIQRRCFAITAFSSLMTAQHLCRCAQRSSDAAGYSPMLQRRSLIRPLGRTQKRVRRLVVDEKLRRRRCLRALVRRRRRRDVSGCQRLVGERSRNRARPRGVGCSQSPQLAVGFVLRARFRLALDPRGVVSSSRLPIDSLPQGPLTRRLTP